MNYKPVCMYRHITSIYNFCLLITLLFLSQTLIGQTKWYTVNNGVAVKNWNDPTSWTLEFDGSVNNPSNKIPEDGDEVFIKFDNTIIFNTDVVDKDYLLLDLSLGSSLSIPAAQTGINFDEIKGEGDLIVEIEESIPTGSYTNVDRGFSNQGQGTLIMNNASDITFASVYTFSSFTKRGAGDLTVLGLTLLDHLKIEEGQVKLDNTSPLVINGDIYIANGASLMDNGSDQEIITLYGNLENRGTFDLGSSTLRFRGSKSQTIQVNVFEGGVSYGYFELNYFDTEKDLKQHEVRINGGEGGLTNFILNQTSTDFIPHFKKGTFIIGDYIQFDLNTTQTTNRDLDGDAILILDSPTCNVFMKQGNALTLYGEIIVREGNFFINQGMDGTGVGPQNGVTLRETGKFSIEKGRAEMRQFRTSILGVGHQGAFSMTGGELYIKNFNNKYQPFSLPYSTTSFTMTGGTITLDGTGSSSPDSGVGMLIESGDGNYNVSDNGKVVFITDVGQELHIASNAPLPNVEVKGNGAVSLRPLTFTSITAEHDLKVNGTLTIDAPFYAGTHKVDIGHDLFINKEDAFFYDQSVSGYKKNDCTITFNGEKTSTIHVDYSLAGIDDAEDDELIFYNVIIDKDEIYDFSPSTSKAIVRVTSGNDTHVKASDTSYSGSDAVDQNDSNILRIANELHINNGLFYQGDYSIRAFGPTVNIGATGQFGYYAEGGTPRSALIKLKSDAQTIYVEDGGRFGNLKLNADENQLTFIGNTHIERGYYRHGTIYIGRYQMKFDKLELDGSFGSYNDGGIDYNNFFMTDGNDSDGGVAIKIDQYTVNNNSSNVNVEIDYPIGFLNDLGEKKYTPFKTVVGLDGGNSMPSVEDGGYISVAPVNSILSTANTVAGTLIDLYWNVRRIDLDDLSIPNYPLMKFRGYLPKSDYTVDTGALFPGKVLNGDQLTVDRLNPTLDPDISIYERKALTFGITETNPSNSGNYSSGSFYEVKYVEDWDLNNTFIHPENASLTVGNAAAFSGETRVFYWKLAGTNEDGDKWNNPDNWLLVEGTNRTDPAPDYPKAGDVVYFDDSEMTGDLSKVSGIHIDANEDMACSRIVFAETNTARHRIHVKENATLTADAVIGEGIFMVYFYENDAKNANLLGDFGDWAKNTGSQLNVRLAENTSKLIKFTELDGVNFYPNVYINSQGDESYTYLGFDNFKAYSFTVANTTNFIVGETNENTSIEVEKTFQLGAYRYGTLIFKNKGGVSVDISCENFVINNSNTPYDDGGYSTFVYDNALADVDHTMTISNDITVNKNTGNASNTYIDWSSANVRVNTSFVGNENSVISHDLGDANQSIKLGKVVVEKDNLTDLVDFESNIGFLNPTATDLTSSEKYFLLNKGTVRLLNANIDLNVNNASDVKGYEFVIPTTGKLQVANGATVRVTGTRAGIQLKGELEIIGGNVLLNADPSYYNFLEYGTSGDAVISIENVYSGDGSTVINLATLDIGSHLRTDNFSNVGILEFNHNSGVVSIGGQTIISDFNDQGVLYLFGSADSEFNLNFEYIDGVNSFTLKGGKGLASDAYFINADKFNVNRFVYNENARIIIDTQETTDFQAYITHLPYLDLRDGSIEFVVDTEIKGGASLASGTILDQGATQIAMFDAEELINNGEWKASAGATFAVDYTEGSESTLVYSGNDVNHEFRNFSILSGNMQFDDNFVSSNVNIEEMLSIDANSTLDLDGATGGISINLIGANQDISGKVTSQSGYYVVFDAPVGITQYLTTDVVEFDYMEVSSPNGLYLDDKTNSSVFYSVRINNDLKLTDGLFHIQEKTLYLSSASTITDGSMGGGFGTTRMIVANGQQRDGGIIKQFVGTDVASYTFPIGTNIEGNPKYSPVELDFTGNAVAGGTEYFIKVLPLDYYYPSLIKSDVVGTPRVLDYTWFLSSLDANGNDVEVPDGFDATLILNYHDEDILQTTADEVDYTSVVFYEGTLAWQQKTGIITLADNNVAFDISKANVLSKLNGGQLSGIYTIGNPDDMATGIKKFYTASALSTSTEHEWEDDIWEVVTLVADGTEDIVIGSETITFTKYKEGARVDALGEFPEDGAIAIIESNKKVLAGDARDRELSEVQINGTVILDTRTGNDYSQGDFGIVSGVGILEMRATAQKPSGNWSAFFNKTTGGEVMVKLPNDDTNFTGSSEAAALLASILEGGTELKALTLTVDDKGSGDPIKYILKNLNYSFGSFIAENGAEVYFENNIITVDRDILINNAYLSTDANCTLTTSKSFVVDGGSTVDLGGNLIIYENIEVDNGEANKIVATNSSKVTFTGATYPTQNVFLNGSKLANVYIDKPNVDDVVDFRDASYITESLEFNYDAYGKVRSGSRSKKGAKVTGNLTIERPRNIYNYSFDRYIYGHTKFVMKQGAATEVVFPIGNEDHIYPIGLSTTNLEHDVVWMADYVDHEDNTDPTTTLPEVGGEFIQDAEKKKIIGMQKNGRWLLEPILNDAEEINVKILQFVNKAQLENTDFDNASLFRTMLESSTISSDEQHSFGIIGGSTEQREVRDSKDIVQFYMYESSEAITYQGKGVFDAEIVIDSDRFSSGRMNMTSGRIATPTNFANGGFRWAYVDDEAITPPELPVELISFTAEVTPTNEVELEWITASEENNDFFLIEKSIDGRVWSQVAEVEGAGNSNVLLKYNHTDSRPFNGTSYYRLTQIDFDGQFEIFEPVSVTVNGQGQAFDVVVYPNPALDSDLNIQVIGSEGRIQAVLYDQFGKVLKSSIEDAQFFKYETQNLPSGMYFLKVIQGSQQQIEKVIIK
ncbi:T9SS type A sorting domain-containing protein [Flammeovirga sp. MY04]|uniref:T9SS type A sorting domain-containing protein n=1 Tax=Flammeovirga sp. MY04 TaxID=1191459 RepID=UPI00130518A6|nr:T9SS type A sorting domain-containing protein [Flammeovirga sp. MY04]ANQ51210.2 T9SS type A sorting domain-containing protein [Flammeovirga sp. MY04]